MKISIDVDCTPQEARGFLGLPDVEGMQQSMMEAVGERMQQAVAAMDPEALMRTWMPAGFESLEGLQKAFWAAATGGAAAGKTSSKGKDKE